MSHDEVETLKAFEYPKRDFLTEEADMVMKGGITSGVVYPLAVCEMAKTKRFRNLGGSSAGGIAAAIAAAAEMGRDKGGFQELAALPDELGRDLGRMFQPSRSTRPLFRIFMAGTDTDGGKPARVLRVLAGVLAAAPVLFVGTLLAGLLLGFWGLLAFGGAPSAAADWARLGVGLAFVALPALGLAVVAALAGFAMSVSGRLEQNGYGMCIGSAGLKWPEKRPAEDNVEPFADWLHTRINAAAKVADVRTHVLTFANLWGAPEGTGVRPDDCDIRLEMMTTNVTFGRPVRLPFEQNLYSYCPTELADYFPPPVIKHLGAHPRPSPDKPSPNSMCPNHPDQVLQRLPVAGDLPVIVAVRMTLSYPGLISAVPLYAVDHGPASPKVVRCWFSDGGVSSNFPIHFFDALWPKRPTFGISLSPYPEGRPREDVYFRDRDTATVPRVRDTSSLAGFVGALLDTLQNWSDEGQSMLPGYRDRIVEVHLDDTEGGINLNMSSRTIRKLCLRGSEAAVALKGFDFAKHRKSRYRTAMAELDRATRAMLSSYDAGLPGGLPGYRQFVVDGSPGAVARTDQLLTFVGREPGDQGQTSGVPEPDFRSTEPKPNPDLRIVAHF